MGGVVECLSTSAVDSVLSSVLTGLPDGVAVFDGNARLVVANPACGILLRLPDGLMRAGTPLRDMAACRLHAAIIAGAEPGGLAHRLDEAEERARRSLMDSFEFRLHQPEGVVLEVTSRPVAIPAGGAWRTGPGFVWTIRDITRQCQAAEAMARRQERYDLALQSANEGLYDWDIGHNTIFFSERLRELFGLNDQQHSPEDWSSRIYPDDRPLYKAAHRAHLKGQTARFACEYRMQTGDGRLLWVRQHGIAVRDAEGRAVRLTGSVADVSEYREATRALRASEERHMMAMQALNEGVYEWSLADGVVHVSERLQMLFGMARPSFPSDGWVDRVHPDDRTRFLLAQRALLKGDVPRLEMDYRLRWGDQSADERGGEDAPEWRWVRHRGVAMRDARGRVVRVIGSSGDITDQRRAEDALQESQRALNVEREILQATLENMDQGIFMADSAQRLVAHNSRFGQMFGFDPGEIVNGMALDDILRRLWQRDAIPQPYERLHETFLGEDCCQTVNTHEIHRMEGQVIEARNVPLGDGRFVRTFTDVTARKQAEAAVRELIEAMPLPLVVTALDSHHVLYANQCAQQAYRIQLGMGAVHSAYVNPAERDLLVAALEQDGEVNDFETRLRTPDGADVWVLMSARRMVYRGQRAILVASLVINERKALERDLTDAKLKAEQALAELQATQQSLIEAEKMASLGGLVAGVAHEINTPVGITLTTASHLQEKVTQLGRLFESGSIRKQDFAAFLSVANSACALLMSNSTRAANLIQSFKQVAVDQASEERRRFDLRSYIDEILLSLGPRLRRSPHRVEVACPEEIEVDSYPGPLSQVLTNFVMNSLLHGLQDDQPGVISIVVERVDAGMPSGAVIEVCYQDSGRGIPAENLKKVFDPFFTTRRGEGGSGLGLNIVYNIVTQTLKGSIRVESPPGSGARFILRFPQRVPQ